MSQFLEGNLSRIFGRPMFDHVIICIKKHKLEKLTYRACGERDSVVLEVVEVLGPPFAVPQRELRM